MKILKNYINGEMLDAASGERIEVFDPAISAAYALTPDSDSRDIDLAIQAARSAFLLWSETPAEERSRILRHIANQIEAKREHLATAESIDTGKPIHTARSVDIPRAAKNFRFFASAILNVSNESYTNESSALHYTLRTPLGAVGCISPWNLPLYLLSWKVAPAIASGNCVIAKPSEITPMTAHLLAEICQEAGLPPGVLNIVHGYGHKAGASLVAHPEVRAISFTGGTKTGVEIAKVAAPMFKKLSLELGGKNPTIVFADCKYDEMLPIAVQAAFSNQGQICLCGSRIFVERPIYNRFREDFVNLVKTWKVGDPLMPDTKVGAVVSLAHFQKVLSYIELAKQEGGNILTGGHSVKLDGRCGQGWFIAPTVIENLSVDCKTNQEEIFGPVATLIPFDAEADVIQYANSTPYGLSASVWTENLTRAHRIAQRIESGIVWINCWMLRDLRTPFGGMKHSGIGREGGFEALRFFSETKSVSIKLS